MKKMCFVVLLVMSSSSFASMSYECWRYVKEEPQGYVIVLANSKSEAEKKAYQKFKNIGKKVEYIKCK